MHMYQFKPLMTSLIFVAAFSTATFTAEVFAAINAAPAISGTPFTVITAGQLYTFASIASDANNDPLTFSILNKPSWATFSKYSGKLTGTPAATGTYQSIVISVSDGKVTTSLP